MTKEELLKRFAECENNLEPVSRTESDYDERESKIKLFKDYHSLISAALLFCPDEFILDGLASLEGFERENSLGTFIKNNNIEEIKSRLNAMLCEIKTLANMFANKNSEKLRNAATALALRNEWLTERQNNNHKIIFPLFIAGFVLFSIIVVIFAGLGAAQYFAEGTVMAKICSVVSTVAGALDAVNGVAFFIYERYDDKKKKDNQSNLKQAISGKTKIQNSNNDIKAGKGSTVRIGDSKSTVEDENPLDEYVIQNSNNKIRAKKKAKIDIGDN